MDFSVVVPTYQGQETIGDCLRSIQREIAGYRAEIVVVDSSTDGTARVVERCCPQATLVHSDRRLSAGSARNLGVKISSGEIVLFVDQDCVVLNGWIAKVLRCFERNPDAHAVGGSVRNQNINNLPGTVLYFLEFLYHLPGPDRDCFDKPFLVACSSAFRREPLEEVEFPDQTLGEDVVFGHRVREAGFTTVFNPSITVGHRNKRGWVRILRYLVRMGRASCSYHSELGLRRFAILYRYPPAVFLSTFVVLPSILLRLLRSKNVRNLLYFVVLFPLCSVGHLAWAAGFYRAIKEQKAGR